MNRVALGDNVLNLSIHIDQIDLAVSTESMLERHERPDEFPVRGS